MSLTLRPTGLSSPAHADRADYTVYDDGKPIGRVYEDEHAAPEHHWFWSITVHVPANLAIETHGQTRELASAKEKFRIAWMRCRTAGVRP